ncbi:hypothetical protein C8R45DRAFT_947023 [Mycena sanguinolenta]|nr:hypothetical protein C8R45DRAFT_947023 [Mycena sanguinolenta]
MGYGARYFTMLLGFRAFSVFLVHKLITAAREREEAGEEDFDEDLLSPSSGSLWKMAGFFPRSLALLFGSGDVKKPVEKPRREQFTREALLMELLVVEESDEVPDDRTLSGSGDEYEE